jgi:hypothetical protein
MTTRERDTLIDSQKIHPSFCSIEHFATIAISRR